MQWLLQWRVAVTSHTAAEIRRRSFNHAFIRPSFIHSFGLSARGGRRCGLWEALKTPRRWSARQRHTTASTLYRVLSSVAPADIDAAVNSIPLTLFLDVTGFRPSSLISRLILFVYISTGVPIRYRGIYTPEIAKIGLNSRCRIWC